MAVEIKLRLARSQGHLLRLELRGVARSSITNKIERRPGSAAVIGFAETDLNVPEIWRTEPQRRFWKTPQQLIRGGGQLCK